MDYSLDREIGEVGVDERDDSGLELEELCWEFVDLG